MITFLRHCLLISIFSFITVSLYASPKYKLVDLGLQESDQSEAVAVNDHGQVIGSYWMFGIKYYFIWTENDGIALLDLPESATISVLNNIGQIAGNYTNSSGQNRGFVWDKWCGFTDIGTLGGRLTNVHDMNDYGQVVGESECEALSLVDERQERHAFIWQNGYMLDLGALTGDLGIPGDRSVATSINNRGQIIGISNSLIAHKRKFLRTNNRSVFWQNGVVDDIDKSIEPQYSAEALSINNHGLATYNDNHSGNFVVDLACKIKTTFQHLNGRYVEVHDNGDLLLFNKHNYTLNKKISDCAYFKKKNTKSDYGNFNTYEHVYFATSFDNPREWKRGSFEGAHDFNNKRWVVGIAENVYDERHGVLLVPIAE